MDYLIDTEPDPGRNLRLYNRLVPKIRYKRYPFIIGIKSEYIKSVLKEIERITGIENIKHVNHRISIERYHKVLPYSDYIKKKSLPPVNKFELRPWIEYIAYKSLEVKSAVVCIWGFETNPSEAVLVLENLIKKSEFFTEKYKNFLCGEGVDENSDELNKYAIVGSFFLECKAHIDGIRNVLNDAFGVIESRFVSKRLWNLSKGVELGEFKIFIKLNESPIIWHWLFQYVRRFGTKDVVDLFVKNSNLMKNVKCWRIMLMYFVEICIKRNLDCGNDNIAYSVIDVFVRNAFFPENKIGVGKALTPESLYMLSTLKYLVNDEIDKEAMNTTLSVADAIDRIEFEYVDSDLIKCVDFSKFPIQESVLAIVDSICFVNDDLSTLLLLFLLIHTEFKDKDIWKKLINVVSNDKIAKKIFKLKFIIDDVEMWASYAQNYRTDYSKRMLVLKNCSQIGGYTPFFIANEISLLDIMRFFNEIIAKILPIPWNKPKVNHFLCELMGRWRRNEYREFMAFPFVEIAKSSIGQVDVDLSLLFLKSCNLRINDLDYFNGLSKSHKGVQLAIFDYLLKQRGEARLLEKIDDMIRYGINVDVDRLLERIASRSPLK